MTLLAPPPRAPFPNAYTSTQGLRAAIAMTLLCLPLLGCPGDDAGTTEEPPPRPATTTGQDQGVDAPEDAEDAPDPREIAAPDDDAPASLTIAELRELRARLGLAPPSPPEIQHLLTRADVREILRYDGALEETTLHGQRPSPAYNALRLATNEGFGVGLQRWVVADTEQLRRRFERLEETYIAVERDGRPVGSAAFAGEFDGLRHYAFRHDPSRSIIVVTAQADLADAERMRALARRTLDRL